MMTSLLLFGVLAAAVPNRQTAAVLDVRGNVGADTLDLTTDALRTAVARAGVFRLQDRAQMQEVLSTQKMNGSDACDEACAVEQGKILQVAHLITGKVMRSGDVATIIVSLTNVETGEVEQASRQTCERCAESDLADAIVFAGKQVIGTLDPDAIFKPAHPPRPPIAAPGLPGEDAVATRAETRRELIIGGVSAFAGAYLIGAGAIWGVEASTCTTANSVNGYTCGDATKQALIPFVGAFMVIGGLKNSVPGENQALTRGIASVALAVGGVIQSVGAILFVIGVALPSLEPRLAPDNER